MKKGKKDQLVPDVNQRKITSFFTGGGNKTDDKVKVNSEPQLKNRSRKPETEGSGQSKAKAKDTSKLSTGDEVIVLSDDSDFDEAKCTVESKSTKTALQNSKDETKKNNANEDTSSSKIINETPSALDKSGGTPETDSGDEFLSQLDIEEVIRSSQERLERVEPACITPVKVNPESETTEEKIYSPKLRTPTKSPKQKINKFSPIRHLQKRSRSRSNSSGRGFGNSPNKLPFSPQKVHLNRNSRSPSSSQKSNISENTNKSSPTKQVFYGEPYYLKNFRTVIESVINDTHSDYLLNSEDRNLVEKFFKLSHQAKCLYVRLFLRKWDWKPVSSIKYPKISENLEPVFVELCTARFLTDLEGDMPPLDKLLDLLTASQIQSLAKEMKVDEAKKTKLVSKASLMKIASRQKSIFGSSSSSSTVIVRKAVQLLGKVYKLETLSRATFIRMFILYSPPQYWEDEQVQATNQVLTILNTDTGNVKYPQYTTSKSARIFPDRDGLINFCNAWTLHNEMFAHIESKNWSDVKEICKESIDYFVKLLDSKESLQHDSSLPAFLRVYTPGSVYARTCWLGVDGYQKCKEYRESNKVISTLLRQDNLYLCHYRGRWHERYVINMKHLKASPLQVKKYIISALQEKHILDAHRLTLSERLKKAHEEHIKASERARKKQKLEEDTEQLISEPLGTFDLKHEIPTMTIEGEKMDNQRKGKSVFLGRKDTSGTSTASSVEMFTINYFLTNEGYRYGTHAEGSIIVTIFGLLFWDEIYCDNLADAFHTPYQAFPLDMHFEDFFDRRKSILLDKLQGMMTTWTIDDALDLLEKKWNAHFETMSIVTWNIFTSADEAKSLLKAFGLPVVAKICERLVRNYRHSRSGFPDLVVWNEKKALIVEVKGPGDSLSTKQMLWIDYLVEIGANVVVCHVASVSNKRIRLDD